MTRTSRWKIYNQIPSKQIDPPFIPTIYLIPVNRIKKGRNRLPLKKSTQLPPIHAGAVGRVPSPAGAHLRRPARLPVPLPVPAPAPAVRIRFLSLVH